MSLRALPLQFLNLGGEMMYIIDQRLLAQDIPPNSACKVRNDIICTMFKKDFIDEIFKPQPMYSRDALKAVFSKLAHASIMRLNAVSMDKLYDLMLMSLKQQMVMATQPFDLLFITMNHIDVMSSFATTNMASDCLHNVLVTFLKTYGHLTQGELSHIRYSLLQFVQDLSVRVSLFLKEQIQTPEGIFSLETCGPVPTGTEVPGTIRIFNQNGEISKTYNFATGGSYTSARPPGVLHEQGNRGTTLGLNMYDGKDATGGKVSMSTNNSGTSNYDDDDGCDPMPSSDCREELNLLVKLIGSKAPEQKEFRLNLFTDDTNVDVEYGSSNQRKATTFDLITYDNHQRAHHKEQLGKIFGELTIDEVVEGEGNDEQEDLLALLDSS